LRKKNRIKYLEQTSLQIYNPKVWGTLKVRAETSGYERAISPMIYVKYKKILSKLYIYIELIGCFTLLYIQLLVIGIQFKLQYADCMIYGLNTRFKNDGRVCFQCRLYCILDTSLTNNLRTQQLYSRSMIINYGYDRVRLQLNFSMIIDRYLYFILEVHFSPLHRICLRSRLQNKSYSIVIKK
jgi:hypothetical protein